MKTNLTKIVAGFCLAAGALLNVQATQAADSPTSDVAAPDSKATITTASGLQYIDLAAGKGENTAQAGNIVYVHYTGWLQNPDGSKGKKFDSSRDRGEPLSFPLGQHRVIPGWDEGVQGMKIGGERRLIIPSALAYGARGAGGVIPPNANLIFDVELVRIQ